MPRDTRKLRVFQIADRLALEMYKATRDLPRQEQFEIGKQLRRAALSREHRRFVSIALGSAAEAHYLSTVAFRLGVMPAAGGPISDYEGLLRGLQKLRASIRSLPDNRA